uniref:Uncharacterized protein n=1 Tax=Anopheles atroparvus TaxID=41427 RepID=A0AAG5D9P7_ANOAO
MQSHVLVTPSLVLQHVVSTDNLPQTHAYGCVSPAVHIPNCPPRAQGPSACRCASAGWLWLIVIDRKFNYRPPRIEQLLQRCGSGWLSLLKHFPSVESVRFCLGVLRVSFYF